MRRLANPLRIAIVLTALTLYSVHITPHLIRQYGHIPPGDVEHLLNQHQNRGYRYRLLLRPADPSGTSKELGTMNQRLGWRDTFFVIQQVLRLRRVEELPGLQMLATMGISGALDVDMEWELDDRKRLTKVSGQGRLGPLDGSFNAVIRGSGLHGYYQLGEGRRQPLSWDDIDNSLQGHISFALVMPSNLAAGMRFSMLSLNPLPHPPYLSQRPLNYAVGEAQDIATGHGPQRCFPITVSDGQQDLMTLWADEQGVVFRADLTALPLSATLDQISDEGGEQLWPPAQVLHQSPP